MTTAYTVPGSPAPYWLKDIAHIANMAVTSTADAITITRTNPKLGWVTETHICVEGYVVYRRLESDADTHFDLAADLTAGSPRLVCEITPELPCPEPGYQEKVRVYGLFRLDLDHAWFELHEVDRVEDAKVAPTPYVSGTG